MNGYRPVFRALVAGPARRHPARVLLPVVGVAIGVAAVAAIHHANRSVTASFRDAAAELAGKSDLVVSGAAGIPLDALRSLAFLWKMGSFAPAVTGPAILEGEPREIAQVLGIDWGGDSAIRDVRLVSPADSAARAALASSGSVFVPAPLAKRRGLSPGSTLDLVSGGKRRSVRVGGILELSGVARVSGGDILLTDVFTAQDLLGKTGLVDRVDIVLDSGVSRDAARSAIAKQLPPGLSVDLPGRAAQTAERMVRAFRFNLNALGSLTLLVGIFLISNAVSIAVLRRRPEIATLRAIGAPRPVIFAAFLAEGLVVGAAGTILGEVLGVVVSRAALASVSGTVSSIYLPAARISGAGYSGVVVLAAAVGMAAAVAATILPALEATRVDPSPALRPGSIEGAFRRRLGARAAAAVLCLAAALVASRADPVDGFPLFGFLAVALVVAALAFASPLGVRAGAAGPGALFARMFGAEGGLAAGFFRGGLVRNGIAVAALAMALGMTLAMIVTVASIRSTVKIWVESTLRSDLWVKADTGGRSGVVGDLPPDVVPFLRGFEGVAAVDPFRARDAVDRDGRPFTIGSGDFRVVARIGGLPLVGGGDPRPVALTARERSEVLVSEPYARRFGARAGEAISIPTPDGPRSFRVAGVYRDYSNDRGTVVLDRELYRSLFRDDRVTSVAVLAAPGIDAGDLRRRILATASGRFAISISTNRELRREALRIFDRTFAVTRALEVIAIGVAVLGIANALVASAVERRRTFGLLRAVGASGTQIRRATLLEAALTGLVGTLAALLAGAAFAALLLGVINPQSFGWTVSLDVPIARLASACGLVLLASIAAGVVPGRIAAVVNPAAALQEE
ncbi:MAG TPA: FtsX-like permease family protein [Thermoanaerobaculia bacterium]|nr:FtsX-like permease family protein [Thermoanaerobaculia bacterium]